MSMPSPRGSGVSAPVQVRPALFIPRWGRHLFASRYRKRASAASPLTGVRPVNGFRLLSPHFCGRPFHTAPRRCSNFSLYRESHRPEPVPCPLCSGGTLNRCCVWAFVRPAFSTLNYRLLSGVVKRHSVFLFAALSPLPASRCVRRVLPSHSKIVHRRTESRKFLENS